jgi:N-acetylmuramoyl-L-alanine amidase
MRVELLVRVGLAAAVVFVVSLIAFATPVKVEATTIQSPMTTYHGHTVSEELEYLLNEEDEVLYIDPIPQDVQCLALNIYYEAGNQPLAGKLAVAHVTMNRMWHRSYPNTICGVVYQAQWRENWKGVEIPVRNKCQFSWFCDGKSDTPTDSKTWDEIIKIADNFLNGPIFDFTEGSTHYHSDKVSPYWRTSLNETVVINNHVFYK